jgi:hypothetical protein
MNPTGIETTFPGTPRSRKAIWTGRILSGLAALFLTFDAAMKVLALPAAVEGTYPTRLSREYAAEHWHPVLPQFTVGDLYLSSSDKSTCS